MNNRNKNIYYSIALISLVLIVYFYRQQTAPNPAENIYVSGTAFGVVPYNIKYIDPQGRQFAEEIDSLLDSFNQSLSTYIPDSEISRFNRAESSFTFESPFFYPVLEASRKAYEQTNGAFDPTVGTLVNAWGFGPGKDGRENRPDPNVDSLQKFVGFDKISFTEQEIRKTTPGLTLDLSAVAKGYGVDLVGDYLTARGINHYMVEIGGEVLCRGNSVSGSPWTIGIDNPSYTEGGSSMSAALHLINQAMATSGNYRNAYEKNGKKYVHTIHPATGYPVMQNLLSATAITDNCAMADAYATAFMVLGYEESKKLAERLGVSVVLIYHEEGIDKTYVSPDLADQMVQ